MRILLIDDNKEFAYILKQKLWELNYEVDIAHTLEQGQEYSSVNAYDLILLDLALPDGFGLELLQQLREQQQNMPVIIISANKDFEVKIDGFGLGADDYLEKPFSVRELDMRIQAILRRIYGFSKAEITVVDFTIHQKEKQISYRGNRLSLGIKEYEILEYLLLNHPKVITSEELIEHIYDEYSNPFSSALRVNLTRVRKKLRIQCGYEVLCSSRGRGYYLCLNQNGTTD